MRTDCTIDKKPVSAPNATLLGFATRRIGFGTYFIFNSSGRELVARSLGRVTAHDIPKGGFVLAMVWFPMGHCAERWIDPADITEAYEYPPTRTAEFFFAKRLPYDAQTMRKLMEHGTIAEPYIDNHSARASKFKATNPE